MTTDDREDFLRRWSRRKHAAARTEKAPEPAGQAPAKADAAPEAKGERPASAPAVPPPLEALTPESDFRAFMDGAVDPRTRNAALKKLFTDPRFNVIDPLDIDIDDYSKLEKLPEAVVKTLAHARDILGSRSEERAGGDRVATPDSQQEPQPRDEVTPGTDATQPPAREVARNEAADPGTGEPGTRNVRERDGNQG